MLLATSDRINNLNEQIETVLPFVFANYRKDAENLQKCRESMLNLINSLEGEAVSIPRIFLQHSLCKILSEESDDAFEFFTNIFTLPLKKNIAAFIAQLISLAIGLNNKQVLTATAIYVAKEQVKLIEDEIRELPLDLADNSPIFAATLIDKGFFSAQTRLYSPQLVTKWLISLNHCQHSSQNITFNGQSLIRYALLGCGQRDSHLHFNILCAIKMKRLQSLSNQFVIDMAKQLSQRGDEDTINKFTQILIVGLKNGICNTLISSNQMKSSLLSIFPDNVLLKTIDKRCR